MPLLPLNDLAGILLKRERGELPLVLLSTIVCQLCQHRLIASQTDASRSSEKAIVVKSLSPQLTTPQVLTSSLRSYVELR